MHSNGMVNLVNKFFEMQHIDALRSLGYIHKAGHQIPSGVTRKDLNTERGSGVRLDRWEGGRKMSSGYIFGSAKRMLVMGRREVFCKERENGNLGMVEVTHRLTNDSSTFLLSDELNSILRDLLSTLSQEHQCSYYRNNA
uniref:Uncharacterized protein n=1 Tax=Solanum lycopersicum TaxID=4081 RepID=A0A3Q7GYZ5_SOLLC